MLPSSPHKFIHIIITYCQHSLSFHGLLRRHKLFENIPATALLSFLAAPTIISQVVHCEAIVSAPISFSLHFLCSLTLSLRRGPPFESFFSSFPKISLRGIPCSHRPLALLYRALSRYRARKLQNEEIYRIILSSSALTFLQYVGHSLHIIRLRNGRARVHRRPFSGWYILAD